MKAEKVERDAARKFSPARQRRKTRNAAQDAARAVARNHSPSPERAQEVAARQRKNMAREARRSEHSKRSSRHREADIEMKLAALEEFRLENLRLEEQLAEAKLKETQARLAKRPITPGDRQRAWEQGREERELIKALEEREAATASERARTEARARQREDDRARRRDARERGLSPSRSDWGDSTRSPSPTSRLNLRVDNLENSHSPHQDTADQVRQAWSRSSSRSRPVRDLSTVPTMSSRHKKTTVDQTSGPGGHLRDKTNLSDTRTQRDLDSKAAAAATSSQPRPATARTQRRLPSPAQEQSSRLTEKHTMSSRHRKTTATPQARVDANDLSNGGVTAAELFAKFQSGQHLRNGRPTAEATQRGDRSKHTSPARHRKESPNALCSAHEQDSVSTRLSTPKRSRGTLFQQAQAEQEAAALVRQPPTVSTRSSTHVVSDCVYTGV